MPFGPPGHRRLLLRSWCQVRWWECGRHELQPLASQSPCNNWVRGRRKGVKNAPPAPCCQPGSPSTIRTTATQVRRKITQIFYEHRIEQYFEPQAFHRGSYIATHQEYTKAVA